MNASACYGGVEELLCVIRRRCPLAALDTIHARGEARFHEIERSLPRASTSTLAERLHSLGHARPIDRHAPAEAAPRTTHVLTASGAEPPARFRRPLDAIQE